MNKKCCLFPLLILPLISGCNEEVKQGNFYFGSVENKIVQLDVSELSAKIDTQHDTFLLATHKGDSCSCWTNFQYVIESYNNKRKNAGLDFLPFYSFDTELIESTTSTLKIDKILSGYVDFYVFSEGEIIEKYTKSAKKDLEMFENIDKFGDIVEKHIKEGPINNYAYVSYDYVRTQLFNKEDNEFVLFTVRSGCGDCSYCMPNVVTPFAKANTLKIPVYICDIEKYRGTDEYDSVKAGLLLTESSNPLGFEKGVVPTYQYYKNGQLVDAGVYANDSFTFDEVSGKVQVSKTYFDGSRGLQYTNINLKEKMNAEETLDVKKYGENYFMQTEKAAVFHNPLLNSFLSYYCLEK